MRAPTHADTTFIATPATVAASPLAGRTPRRGCDPLRSEGPSARAARRFASAVARLVHRVAIAVAPVLAARDRA